jgi:uncharacterized protein (TIGR00730 family)
MRRICVYCGSSGGFDPVYKMAAVEMGRLLAARKIGLVYGAGNIGLMGALADAVLANGGEVTGVIPHHLIEMEVGHNQLTSLIAVDTMHIRKHRMVDLSDAFIAMPGGIGTAEEILEVFTWLQLGIHAKPVALLDTNGYYTHLLQFLEHMETTGFLKREHREMLIVDDDIPRLLEKLEAFVPARIDKRIPAPEIPEVE